MSISAFRVRRPGREQKARGNVVRATLPVKEIEMRVMVFVKGDPQTEEGQLPPEGLVDRMTAYNEELVKAGVLLAADGLYPSSKGVRVHFDGSRRSVIDGPFTESKELVSGYWLWQVRSLDEAIEWLKKAPFEGGDVEIRPIFEADDFLAEYGNDALRSRNEQLKAAVADRA